MKPRILAFGARSTGELLPVALQNDGTPGGVELLGLVGASTPMPQKLLYGVTSTGDILPVLVDANGDLNIDWTP